MGPVIEAGTAHAAIIHLEAKGLNQGQRNPEGRRGASDIAGVRWNLGLEQGDPQGGELSHGTSWPRA